MFVWSNRRSSRISPASATTWPVAVQSQQLPWFRSHQISTDAHQSPSSQACNQCNVITHPSGKSCEATFEKTHWSKVTTACLDSGHQISRDAHLSPSHLVLTKCIDNHHLEPHHIFHSLMFPELLRQPSNCGALCGWLWDEHSHQQRQCSNQGQAMEWHYGMCACVVGCTFHLALLFSHFSFCTTVKNFLSTFYCKGTMQLYCTIVCEHSHFHKMNFHLRKEQCNHAFCNCL